LQRRINRLHRERVRRVRKLSELIGECVQGLDDLRSNGGTPYAQGYLRLGAYIGDGAVVDRQFGTTDVLIILPVAAIDARYFGHFGGPEDTVSALGTPIGRKPS
jgi:hypothetical protein